MVGKQAAERKKINVRLLNLQPKVEDKMEPAGEERVGILARGSLARVARIVLGKHARRESSKCAEHRREGERANRYRKLGRASLFVLERGNGFMW